MASKALIEEVKAEALRRYTHGGWDVIVECYTDEMIAKVIGKATTLKGAVRKMHSVVDVYAEQQADARNSAF